MAEKALKPNSCYCHWFHLQLECQACETDKMGEEIMVVDREELIPEHSLLWS